jgi:hypothetical protein
MRVWVARQAVVRPAHTWHSQVAEHLAKSGWQTCWHSCCRSFCQGGCHEVRRPTGGKISQSLARNFTECHHYATCHMQNPIAKVPPDLSARRARRRQAQQQRSQNRAGLAADTPAAEGGRRRVASSRHSALHAAGGAREYLKGIKKEGKKGQHRGPAAAPPPVLPGPRLENSRKPGPGRPKPGVRPGHQCHSITLQNRR